MTLLLGYAIKVSVLLAVALAGIRLLKNRSAAFRHWLLTASLVAAASVPLLTVVVPSRNIQIPAPDVIASPAPMFEGISGEASAESYYEVEAFPPAATAAAPLARTGVASQDTTPSMNPLRVLFWLWIAGVGVMSGGLATGIARLLLLSRRSQVLREGPWVTLAEEATRRYGLSNRVRLIETSEKSVLATWGLFRPTLLLPAGASSWPEERIRVVLHHELAHVRRRDWLTQMLAETLRAVYWFNPLCWIACEVLVQESEQACDDSALNCGIAGSDYAQQLLALTVALHQPSPALGAAMSMARPSTLERRFAALLNPGENRTANTRISAMLTMIAVFAVAAPIASLRLAAETAAVQVEPPVAAMPAAAPPAAVSSPAALTSEVSGPSPISSPLRTLSAALATLLPQGPAAPAGGASIEGTVVKFGTSEPIAAADVSLQVLPGPGATLGPPTVVQTGADGRFAFRNLPAGNFRLVALRAEGFVVGEYGQQTPNGRGRPVALTDGQRVAGINLGMIPTGSISGRIFDRDGDPLARAQVQALQVVYRDGRRVVKIVQSVQTNDVGEYRLFWLPPDFYYISARPEDTRRRAVPLFVNLPGTGGFFEQAASPVVTQRVLDNGGVSEEAFVLVYFPGTPDFSTASLVDVRPGDSLGGINFAVGAGQVPARHVRGRAVDANGQPISGTAMAIPRTPHPNAKIPSATLDAGGRFDIGGVAPGEYYVVAGNPQGIVAIEVGGSDVDNIVVTSKAGVDLAGRILVEGKPSLETDPDVVRLQGNCGPAGVGIRCLPIRFNLVSEPALLGFPAEIPGGPPVPGGGLPNGAVLNDGTFTLRNLSVRDYRLSVTGLPPDWYVKSARLGPTDPFANLVSFPAQPAEQLEVTLGTNGGRVEGRVVNATGQAVPSASVALIPEQSRRGQRHLYRNAVTDGAGGFRFQSLAPGDYKVFAWEEIELTSWVDPEVIRLYEVRGKSIRIVDGSRESVEAVVIPAQR